MLLLHFAIKNIDIQFNKRLLTMATFMSSYGYVEMFVYQDELIFATIERKMDVGIERISQCQKWTLQSIYMYYCEFSS